MNELLAIGIVLAYMAIGYFLVYPRAKKVSTLRWLDLLFSALALTTAAAIFWVSDPGFWLFGYEANWVVFTLVAYVIFETPAWYWYMKAHPEQGTLAQVYGLRPASNEKLAKNIDTVMNDTKWDAIRTSRAQKLLVILGALSLVAAPLAFWFEDFIKPGYGILAVLPIFLIWWLLRISVRLVADSPDEYLDEFQVRQRDRTYLHSFRILAGVVTALAMALMIVTISSDYQSDGNVDYYKFALTFGQVNAIIWSILGSTILIPNMVLAWNQSKRNVR
ncbi:hypothetical protein HRU87_06385 [Aquiluna borgnonia]|uniref:Uncharacterized protein n=1 Tax=Aquiluna borgnonia TaxID=2499157 RepID=A0A7D4PR95_9MICO|nr:hypothetical protein [Aquiluna borgnonia]QKJ25781.1 hypothetical protein HRU87_06385 [Aquiluna borgnonia]